MSSCPGYNLEDYLAWCYDLRVEDQPEANVSLGLAETLGTIRERPILTKVQFNEIVKLFEEYRNEVEDKLLDFDEDEQSWRNYGCYAFEFLPDELDEVVKTMVNAIAQRIFSGVKLFHLKTTHGLPLEVAVDEIMNRHHLKVDWVEFIEEARKNKWWDFQTIDVIEQALTDADVDRGVRDAILLRTKIYMLEIPFPKTSTNPK